MVQLVRNEIADEEEEVEVGEEVGETCKEDVD